MKITYLVEWSAFNYDGVLRNIDSQVRAWRNAGHLVQLIIILPKIWKRGCNSVSESKGGIVLGYLGGKLLGKLLKIKAIMSAKMAVGLFKPDVLYYRQSSWTPGIASLLMMANVRIFEINSDDVSEIGHGGFVIEKFHLLT